MHSHTHIFFLIMFIIFFFENQNLKLVYVLVCMCVGVFNIYSTIQKYLRASEIIYMYKYENLLRHTLKRVRTHTHNHTQKNVRYQCMLLITVADSSRSPSIHFKNMLVQIAISVSKCFSIPSTQIPSSLVVSFCRIEPHALIPTYYNSKF